MMTFDAYEMVVEESGNEARSRERQALSLGIDRLERLRKGFRDGLVDVVATGHAPHTEFE